MRNRFSTLFRAGVVVFVITAGLRAATVEVRFAGSVLLGFGQIVAGSTFTGTIVYDNTVSETPSSPSGAWFDAVSALEVTYDNGSGGIFSYSSSAGRIIVENDSGAPPTDNLGFSNLPVGTLVGPAMMGLSPDEFFLLLAGGGPGLFPSLNLADLPTTYSLADFSIDLTLEFFGAPGPSSGFVQGQLTSLQARIVPDTDGDGVPDDEDRCVNSDLSPTVIIDGCDTGIDNVLFSNGCTVADLIAEIRDTAGSTGELVSRIARLTLRLARRGILRPGDVRALIRCLLRAGY